MRPEDPFREGHIQFGHPPKDSWQIAVEDENPGRMFGELPSSEEMRRDTADSIADGRISPLYGLYGLLYRTSSFLSVTVSFISHTRDDSLP